MAWGKDYMFKSIKVATLAALAISTATSAHAQCFDYSSLRYGREDVESLPASMCVGVIKHELDRLGASDEVYTNVSNAGRIAGAVEDEVCFDRIRPHNERVEIYLQPGEDYYSQQTSGFNYANAIGRENIDRYNQLLENCNAVAMHYINIFNNTLN